ncbi:MAG: hypothetical protein IT174_01505 [Acidobacteria bacterium]|nr:hypothetical protein [Acidobacteriota bacterium]
MKIAKIVSSNSHIAYIARILEERDGEGVPAADDYGFGQFVAMPGDQGSVVGVICDSRLVNPEYMNNSPRSPSTPALGGLRQDVTDEKKALIGVLLLGTAQAGGISVQSIPQRVIPAGQDVFTMKQEEIDSFHRGEDGSVQLHYFPNLLANAGSLAVPLAQTMIGRITGNCSESDRQRLAVMANALQWKQTFGDLRV